MVKSAVISKGNALRFASKNLRDNFDIVFLAVTTYGRSLAYASEKLR